MYTFCEKFGPQNWWRWKANQLVDELVQQAANHQRDHNWEQKVIIQDEVTLRINAFLADRVQQLFQYGTGEGPLVSFQEKPEAQGQPDQGGKKKPGPKVKQSLKTKGRRTKTGEKPVKTQSSEGPNKRQQLEALLAGQKSELGHEWRAGHRSRDNLCVNCTKCGHFIEQVDSKAIFAKKIGHTCKWMEPSAPGMGEHASHKMVNVGKMWLCCRCGVRQWIGKGELFPSLARQCRQVYLGTDPEILQCIQKFVPSKSGFFKVSQQGAKPASQANEKITQESPATEHGKNLTSDGDAGDEAGGFSAGDGVVPNQTTSDNAVPKTKGDKPQSQNPAPSEDACFGPKPGTNRPRFPEQ